eukprot:517156_1
MCLISAFAQHLQHHTEAEHMFGMVIWGLNISLLILFMIELQFLRNVNWCRLPHAYLVVILSMISSIISSTFFLISQYNSNLSLICQFGPIIAISFRTMSKTFTWGLYIIRGQMVVEALHSFWIFKIATKAHYFLAIQCIIMNVFIIIFTESKSNENINSLAHCIVSYPLWLLIGSMLFGELLYGFGFMYIFLKAMTTTMKHVFNSMRMTDVESTKQQIQHHIAIYMIQTFTSIIFLIIVSLCVCFQTLVFFEAELFISNLCLLMLFREKKQLIQKACNKCFYHNDEENLVRFGLNKKRANSLRNLKARVRSNFFLSDKWRSKKEVNHIKHEINSSINMANLPPLDLRTVKTKSDTVKTKSEFESHDIEMMQFPNLQTQLHSDTIIKTIVSDIKTPLSAPIQPTTKNEEFKSKFSTINTMDRYSLSANVDDSQPIENDFISRNIRVNPDHIHSLSTTDILLNRNKNSKPKQSLMLQMTAIFNKFKNGNVET